MLNEERVILMTKLASYESGEGRKYVRVGAYFRDDYMAYHILGSFLSGTISFLLLLGLYVLYTFEDFMQDIYKIDIMVYAKNILVWYVVFIVAYLIFTYLVYSFKFRKARKSQKVFRQNLKRLSAMYQKKRS